MIDLGLSYSTPFSTLIQYFVVWYTVKEETYLQTFLQFVQFVDFVHCL